MVFSEIVSLRLAFKFPLIVSTFLTFSTSASSSGKFIFYRFLVFVTFLISVLYRVSLLFQHGAENDQQQQETLQVESISSVIDWSFAFWVTVFMAYQVLIKRKSLKVFELLQNIDNIFTSIYGLQMDYTRSFVINCTTISFVLVFCIILSAFNGFKIRETVVMIYDAFTTLIAALFFIILAFISSVCLEIFSRLKLLRKIMDRRVKVSCNSSISNLDNLLTITQLLSETIENLSEFFGVEILMIFGKISWLGFYLLVKGTQSKSGYDKMEYFLQVSSSQ